MDIQELRSQRDSLRAARYQGVLLVRAGDKWVTYKSDREMASALAALERDIAALECRKRRRALYTYAQKGL